MLVCIDTEFLDKIILYGTSDFESGWNRCLTTISNNAISLEDAIKETNETKNN